MRIHKLLLLTFAGTWLFFSPAKAYPIDREQLGEECYEVLHSEDTIDQDLKDSCLEKFKSTLPRIVITPTRRAQDISLAPASAEIVLSQEIEQSGAESLAEALRDVPGIEITDSGQAGLKRIRIRGEESRRVGILIDGQEFADEREVGTPLLIAPELIERIEVVRGTGSVLHGSRAIGGVVNFITKKGGYHPIQGSVSSTYDSATDGNQVFGSLYGLFQGFDYRLSGTIAEHDDRDTPAGEIDNTSFENNSFSLYLGKNFDEHSLAIAYDNFQSNSEVFVEPEVASTPPFLDFRIDAPQRDRSKFSAFYDWEPEYESLERLHIDTYYQESEREFNTFSDLMLDFGAGPFIRNSKVFNSSNLDTIGLNLQLDLPLGDTNHLIIGLEAKRDELEQERLRELKENGSNVPGEFVIDEAHQTAIEGFFQDQWEFQDSWSLVAGLRAYWIESELDETTREGLLLSSTDDQHLITSLGLRYTGIEDATLWASWSQGYASPTLINLATGAFAGPDFVSPNSELDSETSNSFDFGFRFQNNLFKVDSAIFYTRAKDYIDHVRCSSTEVECIQPAVGRRDRVYVNINKVESFGAEMSAAFLPHAQLRPYINASLLRRRFETEVDSTYKTGLPNFSGRLGLELEKNLTTRLDTWLDFYLRVASESKERQNEGTFEEKAGWGTLNLALGVSLGAKRPIRFVLELLNLGDKLYTTSNENLPARGRSAVVKIIGDV